MTVNPLNYCVISHIEELIEIPIMLYPCFVRWMMDDISSLYQFSLLIARQAPLFQQAIIPTEPVLLLYILYIYPSPSPNLSQNTQVENALLFNHNNHNNPKSHQCPRHKIHPNRRRRKPRTILPRRLPPHIHREHIHNRYDHTQARFRRLSDYLASARSEGEEICGC